MSEEERLLLTVLEQVKVPFVQISRLAELAQLSPSTEDWEQVRAAAGSALGLVESYTLSLRLQGKLTPLALEPVTVSSLLYDTAHELQAYARQYDVALELDAGPKLLPILGDKAVLRSALLSLGYTFVEASAAMEQKPAVRLAAHRNRYGTVTGLYTSLQHFGTENLRRAHELKGRARQPLQRLSANPAAGVFVADALLKNLSAHLHVARYHKLTGLAATLSPSQQLQLV
jgi:hypothetical protein